MSCARGAVLLGHGEREIEAAVARADPGDAMRAADRLAEALPGAPAARFTPDAEAARALATTLAVRATDRADVLTLDSEAMLPAVSTRLAQRDVAAVFLAPDALRPALAQALRALATAAGALLVFDETVTGLRRDAGGAQARLGITADLCLWGAGLANGRRLGAVTGEARLLSHAPPGAPAEPDALCAAAATLARLAREPVAPQLAVRGAEIEAELTALLAVTGADAVAEVTGDPAWIEIEIRHPDAARLRRRFTVQLAARGVHAPGPLAVCDRHEDAEVGALLDAMAGALPVLVAAAQRIDRAA